MINPASMPPTYSKDELLKMYDAGEKSKSDIISLFNDYPMIYFPLIIGLSNNKRYLEAIVLINDCIKYLIESPLQRADLVQEFKLLRNKKLCIKKLYINYLIKEGAYMTAKVFIEEELILLTKIDNSVYYGYGSSKQSLFKNQINIDKITTRTELRLKNKLSLVEKFINAFIISIPE